MYNVVVMDTENKITDLLQYIKPSEKTDEKTAERFKHHSNPILKKQLIISVKNNIRKFSVDDLFD